MCGIFGLATASGGDLPKSTLQDVLAYLFKRSELRGMEASGLAFNVNGDITYFKSADRATRMVRSQAYRKYFDGVAQAAFPQPNGHAHEPPRIACFGHSRLVTNGMSALDRNNQPIETSHSLGVHNGIIVNDDVIFRQNPDLVRTAEIDTQALLKLIDKHRSRTGFESQALHAAFAEIEGSATIAYFRADGGCLTLATNTGSLYYIHDPDRKLLVFASEAFTLKEKALARLMGWEAMPADVRQLGANRAVVVDLTTLSLEEVHLDAPPQKVAAIDSFDARSRQSPAFDWKNPQPKNLRRCSKCILPETFPFIAFDAKGVCNFCQHHAEAKYSGRGRLEAALAPYRQSNGTADCLVAFSGGRDSAYGLHYLVREMGMRPIAFTYDWGMVTDNGRRNQARLVGKLGVEHIIRSPDIRRKRDYIRMNVKAWLKRPDLGMIPLFSAGDKQFYHYGRVLRAENDIRLTVFCAGNPFEMTAFKTGFCGIREDAHGGKLNAMGIANKVKFISYYLGQYLRNPRYLNASLVDTLAAYYSTYVAKDDFLYVFHYIPWDEKIILDTLRSEYGWEGVADTDVTWRLDDAFTPFHNYIYYTIAGFSEHDTYRSHQVRAGLLPRDEALRLAEDDNQPRMTAMQDYAQMLGINLEQTLRTINASPKLYG